MTANISTTIPVLSDEVLSRIQRCQIISNHIKIGQQIGRGFYVIVYKGTYQQLGQRELDVGIKTLKGRMYNEHAYVCVILCVYAWGDVSGYYLVVCDYVCGFVCPYFLLHDINMSLV